MLSAFKSETVRLLATINKRTMSTIKLKKIFLESVRAVQPHALVESQVNLRERHLSLMNDTIPLGKRCFVVGFGKAVLRMALAMEKILEENLERAVVSVPKGILKKNAQLVEKSKIHFIEGAENNLPDEDALKAAQEIKKLVGGLEEDDLLFVLISGGGSALLPSTPPPITLQEKLQVITKLTCDGADIQQLNCIRKQISELKGGGLAEIAYPCRVIGLILSDVIGDPLDVIASGPTVPNKDTVEDAIKILEEHSIYDETPESIKSVLRKGNQLTRPVAPIANGKYEHVTNYIIGNNKIAAEAAKNEALRYGFQSVVVSTEIDGNVDEIGEIYARMACNFTDVISNCSKKEDLKCYLKQLKWCVEDTTIEEIMRMDFSREICLVLAGEPTVMITGTGTGGRNQQLALAFSLQLNKFGSKSADISFLSCGTDGIDGPTDAAGAIGSSELLQDCRRQNINPLPYLENNDSYGFYSGYRRGEYLVKIGHTGTNVMDIHLILMKPKKAREHTA